MIENIGKHMIAAVKAGYKNNGHPRLILTEKDYLRIREHRNEGVYKILCDKVIAESESLLAKPENTYRIPDGIRLLGVSRDILNRVLNLGIAYNITGEEKYKEWFEKITAYAVEHFSDREYGEWLGYLRQGRGLCKL